jgi:hypothetical protein
MGMRSLLVRGAPTLDLLALASAAAAALGAALIWRHADRLLPTFASGSHAHLTSSHDSALVILSVAISVFASYTALDLTGREPGVIHSSPFGWDRTKLCALADRCRWHDRLDCPRPLSAALRHALGLLLASLEYTRPLSVTADMIGASFGLLVAFLLILFGLGIAVTAAAWLPDLPPPAT